MYTIIGTTSAVAITVPVATVATISNSSITHSNGTDNNGNNTGNSDNATPSTPTNRDDNLVIPRINSSISILGDFNDLYSSKKNNIVTNLDNIIKEEKNLWLISNYYVLSLSSSKYEY